MQIRTIEQIKHDEQIDFADRPPFLFDSVDWKIEIAKARIDLAANAASLGLAS